MIFYSRHTQMDVVILNTLNSVVSTLPCNFKVSSKVQMNSYPSWFCCQYSRNGFIYMDMSFVIQV